VDGRHPLSAVLAGGRAAYLAAMMRDLMNAFPEPARRAEGHPAGCFVPINSWTLDPVLELPGRLCPMFVLPPPRRSLLRRLAAAIGGLGGAIAAGAGLMVLAAHLTTL
jgi:hypothetical protein